MNGTRLRLNSTQAAEYAGCHRETVVRAAEAGELHGGQRRARGRWSFKAECVEAWAEGRKCAHQQDAA